MKPINNASTKDELLNLNWIGTGSISRPKSQKDVSISLCKDNRISFTLRNECWKKMAVNGAYSKVEFALFNDNIIVFRSSSKGFVLSCASESHHTRNFKYNSVAKNADKVLTKKLLDFVGNYDLKFEEKFGLWYIDKNDKEVV